MVNYYDGYAPTSSFMVEFDKTVQYTGDNWKPDKVFIITPNDRWFSYTHQWYKVEDGIVTIGITRYAANELTEIIYINLPAIDTIIITEQPFCEIESSKATSELFAAITGKVIEVNTQLTNAPNLVNNDPFGGGWLVKIRPDNLSNLDQLMDSKTYDEMVVR
jgi:glycine cleavage system H protein